MKRVFETHLVEHEGYFWCEAGSKQRVLNGGRRRKRCYATIEEAWIASFVTFIRRLSWQRIVFHPNPWSTRGWISRIYFNGEPDPEPVVERSDAKASIAGWSRF